MIELENINFYYGNVQALFNVSMKVEEKSIQAIMGRNGVGKTTLMGNLVGTLQSESGSIFFEGEDCVKEPAYKRVKRGIGYVPQGRQIFPRLTVEENLKNGLALAGENRLLRKGKSGGAPAGIPEELYEYFPVLAEMKGRMGGDLSGGQQQQLAIARALVPDPRVLILDEPTEGIQPNIIQRIGEVLSRLSKEKGMTIIIVEQYLDFIKEFTSDFSIMNGGKLMVSGKPLS